MPADTSQPTAEAQLDRLLQLALAARIANGGPQWKTDMEAAIARYGDACDAVWTELNRLLDERVASGRVVEPIKPPPDPAKALRKRITARLRADLPAAIAAIVEEELADAA